MSIRDYFSSPEKEKKMVFDTSKDASNARKRQIDTPDSSGANLTSSSSREGTVKKRRQLPSGASHNENDAKTPQRAISNSSQPNTSVVPNETIIKILDEVGKLEGRNGSRVKARAYAMAVQSIKSYGKPIKSGAEAIKLKGVGGKIAKKIDEILAEGKLRKLVTAMSDDFQVALELISRVSGVGAVSALRWVKNGVRTIEDLRKQKLNHHQQIGLKYFYHFEIRIPRAEMMKLRDFVVCKAREVDPLTRLEICGSFRRGLPDSGDIDILLTHPKYTSKTNKKSQPLHLERVVNALTHCGFLIDHLASGRMKYMGVCRLPSQGDEPPATARRIDIKMVPFDQYACAIMYFTGSDTFNQNMRLKAKKMGLTLNEYNLCHVIDVNSSGVEKKGEAIPIASEQDIFDALDMEYVAPENR